MSYTDTQRFNWLQSVMTPKENSVEVYLAGLRNGDAPATEFQFEANPHFPKWSLAIGKNLRSAIDEAIRNHPETAVNRSKLPAAFELVAVHDGRGESACWGLYVEYDGESVADLPWPKDWPENVNGEFLEQRGFRIITA